MARTVSVQPTVYSLKVTLSGGTPSDPTFVRAHNRVTREFVEVKAQSNTAMINLADLSSDGKDTGTFSGFSNGQEIEIRCNGGRMGSAVHTIATGKGGGSVTVTVVAVDGTSTPVISV